MELLDGRDVQTALLLGDAFMLVSVPPLLLKNFYIIYCLPHPKLCELCSIAVALPHPKYVLCCPLVRLTSNRVLP